MAFWPSQEHAPWKVARSPISQAGEQRLGKSSQSSGLKPGLFYLSEAAVLKEPTREGHLQRVSHFHALAFSDHQVLEQHRVGGRTAVVFGNAELRGKKWVLSAFGLEPAQQVQPP